MRRQVQAVMAVFARAVTVSVVTAPPLWAEDGVRTCIISKLSGGDVTLEVGGTPQPASEGAMVPVGAIVTTNADARAEIGCDDGVTITIGADSRIDLGALAGPKGEEQGILMRLFGGIVGIDAPNRTWGSFEVETDLAIASVRSTAWLVEANPDTGTGVFVKRGRVEVHAGDDQAVLAAGEGVDVPPAVGAGTRGLTPDGKPVAEMKPVAKWGKARLKAADTALGLDWTGG